MTTIREMVSEVLDNLERFPKGCQAPGLGCHFVGGVRSGRKTWGHTPVKCLKIWVFERNDALAAAVFGARAD